MKKKNIGKGLALPLRTPLLGGGGGKVLSFRQEEPLEDYFGGKQSYLWVVRYVALRARSVIVYMSFIATEDSKPKLVNRKSTGDKVRK